MSNNARHAGFFLLGALTSLLVAVPLATRGRIPAGASDRSKTDSALHSLSRETIANLYIRGEGLEIGALHLPTKLPAAARVQYVDILPKEELEKHYPELLDEYEFVEVDIVDDGEYLRKVEDRTQNFVIANHFLEHCQNPIAAVENMLRVLKPGGILFMAVPDKRYTFDKDRPITDFDHLLRDYLQGPEWSRRLHFREWVMMVDKVWGRESVEREVDRLMAMNYSIHYHVWRQVDLSELLVKLRIELDFPFDIELVHRNSAKGNEVILVLRKT